MPEKRYHVRQPLSDGSVFEADYDHVPTADEILRHARVGRSNAKHESIGPKPEMSLIDHVRNTVAGYASDRRERDELKSQGVPMTKDLLDMVKEPPLPLMAGAIPAIAAAPAATLASLVMGFLGNKLGTEVGGGALEAMVPGAESLGRDVGGVAGSLLGGAAPLAFPGVRAAVAGAEPVMSRGFNPPSGAGAPTPFQKLVGSDMPVAPELQDVNLQSLVGMPGSAQRAPMGMPAPSQPSPKSPVSPTTLSAAIAAAGQIVKKNPGASNMEEVIPPEILNILQESGVWQGGRILGGMAGTAMGVPGVGKSVGGHIATKLFNIFRRSKGMAPIAETVAEEPLPPSPPAGASSSGTTIAEPPIMPTVNLKTFSESAPSAGISSGTTVAEPPVLPDFVMKYSPAQSSSSTVPDAKLIADIKAANKGISHENAVGLAKAAQRQQSIPKAAEPRGATTTTTGPKLDPKLQAQIDAAVARGKATIGDTIGTPTATPSQPGVHGTNTVSNDSEGISLENIFKSMLGGMESGERPFVTPEITDAIAKSDMGGEAIANATGKPKAPYNPRAVGTNAKPGPPATPDSEIQDALQASIDATKPKASKAPVKPAAETTKTPSKAPSGSMVSDDLAAAVAEADQAVPEKPAVTTTSKTKNNASGESAASQEAINRQSAMKGKKEQYVVYDRAGNKRPLIGPDAVDYVAKKGETYGVEGPSGFRALDNKGGKVPTGPAAATKVEAKPTSTSATATIGGKTYKVGDTLPDGRKVLEIDNGVPVLSKRKAS